MKKEERICERKRGEDFITDLKYHMKKRVDTERGIRGKPDRACGERTLTYYAPWARDRNKVNVQR